MNRLHKAEGNAEESHLHFSVVLRLTTNKNNRDQDHKQVEMEYKFIPRLIRKAEKSQFSEGEV